MNKGKQVFTASILAAVLVVSIAVLSVPEAAGLHPIDIVGAIDPGDLALNLLEPLGFNVALETDGAGEIVSSAVTATELNLLDDRTGTLLTTNQANTITALQTLDVTGGIQINDQDGTPVADRRLSVIDGLFVARSTGDAEGRHISRASLELIEDDEIAALAGIVVTKLAFGAANEVLKTNTGGTANEFGKIADANVAAGALIAFSKLGILTEGNILIGGGGGVVTSVDPSGSDVEASTGSGLIIGDNKVNSAKLADAIELPTSLKVGVSGVTVKGILFGASGAVMGVGPHAVTVTGSAATDVAFCTVADSDNIVTLITGEIVGSAVQVTLTGSTTGTNSVISCIVFDVT